MDLTQLRAYLGKTAEEKPDEEIPALALSAMTETSQKLADQTEANQVLAGELSVAETARDEAKSALALAANESDDEPKELDPRLAAMLSDNVSTARELALSAGVTPAQIKLFDDILNGSDGKPTALALSAGAQSTHPIAFQVYKALQMLGDGFIKIQNAVVRGKPAKSLALSADGEDGEVTEDRLNKNRADWNLPQVAK